ncbi:MAG: trehalose-phosphatase [Synergistales bacterium]|nr:trehalose-phosphatase [Synergistales bacterium]
MPEGKTVLNIRRQDFDAVLFDLDGVITRTARAHAISWKKLFDEYLEKAPGLDEHQRQPFDMEKDYRSYVDGKPRYDGVRSFLESRGIFLDHGTPDDTPEEKTICGLGNRKNMIFHEYLENNGVDIHKGSRELVLLLKQKGFRTAVVTSSRNCSLVLKAAELENLFDAQVDGLVSEELGLKGKPHPDIFLEASRQLKVSPERAMVFEDALAGVESGRNGNFGCVVGVDRTGQKERLLEKGAHIVVNDLSTIKVEGSNLLWATRIGDLPSALDEVESIKTEAKDRQLVISLDYDGTLTPIVDRPEMAVLSDNMKKCLQKVSAKFPVIIISGRDLDDIRDLIRLEGLIYAGSHGFDISSPREMDLAFQMGEEFLPLLDRIETLLKKEISKIEGTIVERKKFSIAVHYRLVSEGQAWKVEKIVDDILAETPRLRKGFGKMVFELKPDIDWDKGKALLWLLEGLQMDMDKTLPIYIGDDITDEDAFLVLQGSGIGIVVREGETLRNSMARYALENTVEVKDLLEVLAGMSLEGGIS